MTSATSVATTATDYYINLENEYGAHNYHPMLVVIAKGRGVFLWDVEGKQYFDFLSGYSAVNQGHCHPKIIKTLQEQAQQLTLPSRAFYNNKLGTYEKYLTELFGYDKLLPMNTGVEAVETAIKLCRKWAYTHKAIPENEAVIVVCKNNFHGRTINVISFSTDETARNGFGPFTPGYVAIPYNDINALQEVLENNPSIAGFLFEPIQGEAGVLVPNDGYYQQVRQLCTKYNVLMMADEIQTGLGRTGYLLACDREDVKPDIVILGKALSGGTVPVSCVLANNEIMLSIHPGEHGSTFGGNPLASAIAITSVQSILDENMSQNAQIRGEELRNGLKQINNKYISDIRGRGLLNAIEIEHPNKNAAWNLCEAFMHNGLLAKPTHGNKIRLSPPLIITQNQVQQAVQIIEKSLGVLDDLIA